MTRWTLLDIAPASESTGELRLYKRGEEFSIRVGNCELMNSRVHGSEDALGELACARIADRPHPRALIGGLGMGYTLRAVLNELAADGQVVVAELVPAVVDWNRGPLGHLAGHPLQDGRVTVREIDVARIIRAEQHAYDAILLDVDNGPKGLTGTDNDRLYGLSGLRQAFVALQPGGVLAVWSAGPDPAFTQRLREVGFKVDEIRARARGARGGARHTVWIAETVNLENPRATRTGQIASPFKNTPKERIPPSASEY
jgi:spermidine synthase